MLVEVSVLVLGTPIFYVVSGGRVPWSVVVVVVGLVVVLVVLGVCVRWGWRICPVVGWVVVVWGKGMGVLWLACRGQS